MFLKTSQSGYTRHGEQFARGSFLILFSHNQYKWEDQNNRPHYEDHGKTFDVILGDGFTVQRKCRCGGEYGFITNRVENGLTENPPVYCLKYCPVHSGEWKSMPAELNRKLYACVRHVSLRQLGHFMMGTARIAGQSVTLSGSYGSDGLPRDYESLTPAARAKLVEVPPEIAEVYWKGDGWNSAGNEAPTMRQWAAQAFNR
jgi:hypothetical protein